MNPIRKKRIYSILFVLLFSISGISLILYSLNSNLDYFFTPTELKDRNIPALFAPMIETAPAQQ